MIHKNTCYSRSEPDVGQHSRSSHGVAVLLVNDDVVYQLDAYAVQRGGGTAVDAMSADDGRSTPCGWLCVRIILVHEVRTDFITISCRLGDSLNSWAALRYLGFTDKIEVLIKEENVRFLGGAVLEKLVAEFPHAFGAG